MKATERRGSEEEELERLYCQVISTKILQIFESWFGYPTRVNMRELNEQASGSVIG